MATYIYCMSYLQLHRRSLSFSRTFLALAAAWFHPGTGSPGTLLRTEWDTRSPGDSCFSKGMSNFSYYELYILVFLYLSFLTVGPKNRASVIPRRMERATRVRIRGSCFLDIL